MQRILFFLALALLLSACDNATDPGDNPSEPGTISVQQVTDLPMTGGDVTGIALTPQNTIVAVVDGKLVTMSLDGTSMQTVNAEVAHMTMSMAPSGKVYTVTATELRTYDLTAGTHKTVPIDPAGPLAIGRRVEFAEVVFSPTGEPYVRLINNTPQTYIYRSTDEGTSWQLMPNPPGAVYNMGFTIAPNGDLLMTSAFGFYRSTDGGTTWSTSTAPYANYGPDLLVTSTGDIYTYVRGGGGLKKSSDGGASFTDLQQFNQTPFFRSIKEGPDHSLYALASRGSGSSDPAMYPTSFYRSTDGGATWRQITFAQGRVFAMRGQTTVIGLGVVQGFGTQEHGGFLVSQNSNATWTPVGNTPVKQITDVGFDKEGNLLILADQGLFRRGASGWEALGTQPGVFGRFASTPQGTLLLANTSSVFHSTDNGLSWKMSLIQDYQPGLDPAGIPALIGRRNGEFLFSITDYSDARGYTNGHLYRVGADGVPVRITGVTQAFSGLAEDRNGKLYGGTQTVDPFSQTFVGRGYTSNTSGTSWDEDKSAVSGVSFNSQNRYFIVLSISTYAIRGLDGSSSDVTLKGFGSQGNYITRKIFGPDDRLYLVTLDKGLYISDAPVK